MENGERESQGGYGEGGGESQTENRREERVERQAERQWMKVGGWRNNESWTRVEWSRGDPSRREDKERGIDRVEEIWGGRRGVKRRGGPGDLGELLNLEELWMCPGDRGQLCLVSGESIRVWDCFPESLDAEYNHICWGPSVCIGSHPDPSASAGLSSLNACHMNQSLKSLAYQSLTKSCEDVPKQLATKPRISPSLQPLTMFANQILRGWRPQCPGARRGSLQWHLVSLMLYTNSQLDPTASAKTKQG